MATAVNEGLEGADAQPVLRIEHLSKTFPGQRALADVSIDVLPGEIHALVGQNGSGKSTLIKTLSGFHKPDPGAAAWLDGTEITLGTLGQEERARIAFIHQDLALVPSLTVRENLGLEWPKSHLLRPFKRRAERKATRDLLANFGVMVDPDAVVSTLTPFEQSAVAICRALGSVDGVRLLVLDEPTAALGAAEAEQLFAILRRLSARGVGILYVSHFLHEVLDIGDRITVLRDGQKVSVCDAKTTTEADLVELIVGKHVKRAEPPAADLVGDDAPLVLHDVTAPGIQNVSIRLRRGEVLGITGLVGSGFEIVPQCVSGAIPLKSGEVEVNGKRYSSLSPKSAIRAGVTSVPADRRVLGLIPTFTVAENVTLPRIGDSWRGGFIRGRVEHADVLHWLEVTDVKPPDPHRLVQELSGGNQQKVLLAKALRLRPKVLVLAEPTQAVDVGASASIRQLITSLASEGQAVLVSSSDAEELEQICQRVLVMRSGRVACELVGSEITEDRILFESQFEGGTIPAGGTP